MIELEHYTLEDDSFEWRGTWVGCVRVTCKHCGDDGLFGADLDRAHQVARKHLGEKHQISLT